MIHKIEKRIIDQKEEEAIIAAIRDIRPQSRGAVVTSGGDMLPLSGRKKLNLSNTPILLVKSDGRPEYVFPCKVEEKYYDVLQGISFLVQNLPERVKLEGEGETPISSKLKESPKSLEDDLEFDAYEVETGSGVADLLFHDCNGRHLLIEVEREASDATIGQILRLCAGFEKKNGLEPGSVRTGIVCLRANRNVVSAADRARIEIWKTDPKIQHFSKEPSSG